MRRWPVVTIVVTLFTVMTSNYTHAVPGPLRETPTALLENLTKLETLEALESLDYGDLIVLDDSSGALYDVHAPQVELPQLGRPST